MNIYEKLIEVRKKVDHLKKDQQGYQFRYVSSSQVLSALRAKMDEVGLLLVPHVLEHTLHPKGQASEKEHLTELVMQYTWVNAEKPEERLECQWYAQGLDTGERGPGKAMTYAEKYFLLKLFNIATDEDDPDARQRRNGNKKAAKSSGGKPKGNGKVSEKQLRYMYALAEEAEVTKEQVKAAISAYGKESSKELSSKEASDLIEWLESQKAKKPAQ